MRWSLEVSTAPATEPVSTADAKAHMKIDTADDDELIDSWVVAARILIEKNWGVSLITQTLKLRLDHFPHDGQRIMLPAPPAATITSVQYVDNDGNTQTWASSNYAIAVNDRPGTLSRAYNVSYPTTRSIDNAVTITYTAGYGVASAIPANIIHAIKLLLTLWNEAREAACPVNLTEIPFGVDALLVDHKTYYRGPVV